VFLSFNSHTQRQTMNIFLPLMFPAQFECFISSVVTMILVGKAAIINFMFFYHHNTDIWFTNDSPASKRFAGMWCKLLTERMMEICLRTS
ncbi:unnamed protein product, partial [Bubo scandiacus]